MLTEKQMARLAHLVYETEIAEISMQYYWDVGRMETYENHSKHYAAVHAQASIAEDLLGVDAHTFMQSDRANAERERARAEAKRSWGTTILTDYIKHAEDRIKRIQEKYGITDADA
jgi:hypothetical protein